MNTTPLPRHMPAPVLTNRWVSVPLLLCAPAVIVWATWTMTAGRGEMGLHTTAMLTAIVVAGFSPLPLSIPALLCAPSRDWALNDWWHSGLLRRNALNLARGVALVPYLMMSPRSCVRIETTAALIGWISGTAALYWVSTRG